MVNSDRSEERTSGSWLARFLRRLRGGGGRSRNKGVRPGDRFGKIGEVFEGTQTVWRVWGISDFVEMTHVKLIQEEPPHRIVTVSLSTLLDKRFYRRLPPAVDSPVADSSVRPTVKTTAEEPFVGANVHDQTRSAQDLAQTAETASRDEVIRFVGPEGRTEGGSRTNPFSKARTAKRQAENKTSGVGH